MHQCHDCKRISKEIVRAGTLLSIAECGLEAIKEFSKDATDAKFMASNCLAKLLKYKNREKVY